MAAKDWVSCYVADDANWLTCALGDLTSSFGGEANFGLAIGGAAILIFFIAGDGDYSTPAVMLMLVGGVLVPMLTGGFGEMAMTIMFLGLVAGLMAVGRRYLMQGVR